MKIIHLKFIALYCCFLICSLGINAQQIIEDPYTLDQINVKISVQNSKLEHIENRTSLIVSSNTDGSYNSVLSQLQMSREEVLQEISRLEGIRNSILIGQNNNVPVYQNTGDTEQDNANLIMAKEQYYQANPVITSQILQYKQADFDLLPQHKKDIIIAHPELYQIIP